MTVKELIDELQKLEQEGKGDYTVSIDGYVDIDTSVNDIIKEFIFW